MKKSILDHALKIRLPITVLVILISYAVTFFVSRAERDGVGYTPQQPIAFSHKLHAGQMSIDCKYCHTEVEKSRHAGIPATDICMNCHNVARKTKPEIQKLVKFYEENKPIPWKRIHKVPDYAYFNHSVHVNKGMQCRHCHEDVATMDVVGQKHSFTMGSCLNCHRNPSEKMPDLFAGDTSKVKIKKGPENCNACHR